MLNQLLKLKEFLGKKIINLIVISSIIGMLSFAVESSFIFILQLFLINLGLIDKQTSFLPDWVPSTPEWSFGLLVLFGLIRGIVAALRHYTSVKTQQAFVIDQRMNLLRLALNLGGRISTKELISAFTEITSQAGEVIRQASQLFTVSVSALLFFFYGLKLAPKEMLIGFALLALMSVPFKSLSRKISSSGKELIEYFTSVNNSLLLGIKNNFLLKLYSLQEQEIKRGQYFLEEYEKSFLNFGRTSSLMMAIPTISGVFVIATLAYLGINYFNTPGLKLITFFYIFMRFAQAVSEIITILASIRLNTEGFKKLYQWSIKKDDSIRKNISTTILPAEKGIILEAKSIGFNFDHKPVFSNVSLKITTGNILLIKGESGTGKSTMLNVLLGMYAPTSGEIFYNDAKGAPSNISEIIGYVGPDSYIIPGTIKENLLYGLNVEKSDDQVWDSLRKAHLTETIEKLPGKLHEQLSDTAELSTGQKQRLAIARALLRNPKILILDEATSNLDPISEKLIIQNISELSKDLIIIAVSHRDCFDEIATERLLMEH